MISRGKKGYKVLPNYLVLMLTFQNFIVLSFVDRRNNAPFAA
jgi:uncharacterized protein YktB (UPF0637 family)